jgi:DegV family protein with EDD domain
MWLTIGMDQYRDGDLSLAQVVARLGEGLSTSGPAPGELAKVIDQADNGDGAVVLTVSRKMSSSHGSALLAASLTEKGAGRTAVVDTGTAAGAQGLVVLAAVVAAAKKAAEATRLVATLPRLDNLARSGRVPGAAAWGARWLGLHPMFEFRASVVRPLRPARGHQQALERIVQLWARSAAVHSQRGDVLHVAAMHSLEPSAADQLLDQVRRQIGPNRLVTAFSSAFSPVMVAHTGPGLVGLAWTWEDAG